MTYSLLSQTHMTTGLTATSYICHIIYLQGVLWGKFNYRLWVVRTEFRNLGEHIGTYFWCLTVSQCKSRLAGMHTVDTDPVLCGNLAKWHII